VLQKEANNPIALFNLGMAYSDTGRLADAEKVLLVLVTVDPGMTDARVALGVAYLRMGRLVDAVRELRQAVADQPENPWAQRNLGAALLQMGDPHAAVEHLLRATSMNPKDQNAYLGLGQAYQALGQLPEADRAYLEAIRLNERNEVAEKAKGGRSAIAELIFKSDGGATPRMDAVMYCLAAIEKFQTMTDDQLKPLILEIAMLGPRAWTCMIPSSSTSSALCRAALAAYNWSATCMWGSSGLLPVRIMVLIWPRNTRLP